MTGDYTKVPLRPNERWTGARMQQGRVLLDHEWNLNLDAAGRQGQDLAADVIGPAGVVAGSTAFEVTGVVVDGSGGLDLELGAGHLWVGGMEAIATAPFHYRDQESIPPLPEAGRAFVYLDAFPEHVQPAEDPAELVDPALAPIESAARTLVGWRVRVRPTDALSCAAAFAEVTDPTLSDATLTVSRVAPATPPDPCDPPGDPLGVLPDGLLRIEVLDAGTPATARLAWSFEDGAAAVAVATFAGDQVTLAPSVDTKFATGDLVEVSWLIRRADRLDHGALFAVVDVAPGPGGDVLTLSAPVPSGLAGAEGLAVRRWDGEVVGATSDQVATLRGTDLGVRFRAAGTSLLPGDWWGARLRESGNPPVEPRTAAAPDGTPHAFAPLALVDLGARTVLSDCRPTFLPLTELDPGHGVCTVTARPGDDLQQAADSLPAGGGELCLEAGVYALAAPVVLTGRRRVVVSGVGPATVLRVEGHESALVFDRCTDVEVRHLRAEGGTPRPSEAHRNGAVTFLGCAGIRVAECDLACPAAVGTSSQACLTVRPATDGTLPERVRIEGNNLEVGAWQTGVLVVGAATVAVAGNHVRTAAPRLVLRLPRHEGFLGILAQALAADVLPPARRGAKPRVDPASPFSPLAKRFAAFTTPKQLRATPEPAAAAARFARRLAATPVERLDQAERAALLPILRFPSPALQGIVVGGVRAETVSIRDNVVDGTVQGIHVGTSDARQQGRESAAEVVIARNAIHSRVPSTYNRDRHAVFVGNTRSLHVVDTDATLQRVGLVPTGAKPTPVEAVRVHGVLGPFMVVRQTSVQGFTVGVRVVPLAPLPGAKGRVWLVAETMAAGPAGTRGADLPPSSSPAFVEAQRNVP